MDYTFFWGKESPFSQWHDAKFIVDGVEFFCAEQYMMYKKAELFHDDESALKILTAKTARECKSLGRSVSNFDARLWHDNRIKIVYSGNHAKFTQNEQLKHKLLSTVGTVLVEASPVDYIWGIGLDQDDAKKIPESEWPGQNLLGKTLTRLRDDLIVAERRKEV